MPDNLPPEVAADMVRKIYNRVLEREADDSGLMTYGGFLDRGEWSVRQVVRDVGKSAEYRDTFVAPVTLDQAARLMYKHFLARDPESEDVVKAWAGTIAEHGWKYAVDGFVNSEEYVNRFGETSVPA